MTSEVYREIDRCYEFIANMLNEHYRVDLLEIDEVKRGKFIVEYSPESGDPEILFIWHNDFGLERLENMDEDTEEEGKRVIREVVLPASKKVRRRVMEIESKFGDDFYPRINSFHHLHVQNYALEIARDEAN